MEGKKTDVCRFFLKGQCKNGDRCAFEHPQGKEKQVSKEPPVRSRPQQEERVEVEIKDPEALQKMRYLAGLKASLRKPCQGCKSKQLLAMLSCGCQLLCKGCAAGAKQCPEHRIAVDPALIIGGEE